jgi:hypothetical protein
LQGGIVESSHDFSSRFLFLVSATRAEQATP